MPPVFDCRPVQWSFGNCDTPRLRPSSFEAKAVSLEVLASDLRDARRYLPGAARADRVAFARRQLSARARLAGLLRFYGRHPCRMAQVHLLSASSVVVGRLCGFSHSFNALGAAVMPVDDDGRPRSAAWADYQAACVAGRSWTVRDELWLEA